MLTATLIAGTAFADQTRPLTAAEAASQAQRQYGGKVLDIRLRKNGRYRVKILQEGRILVIEIDRNRTRGKD